MSEKASLRRTMRELKSSISERDKAVFDSAICNKLLARAHGRSPVAAYLALPNEISLDACIASLLSRGTEVVSPRWNGEHYELAKLKSLDSTSLRLGPMNILEPADAEIVAPEDVSLWIVPGLAFTRCGDRLGYGGGWYDRFLANASPSAPRLGVAYSFQLVDSLPVEPHDMKVTEVVDET